MKLTIQDARTLVAFFRQYLECVRESTTLKAILQEAVRKKVCPLDWEDRLRAAKTFPQYTDIGKELESILARFERDADEKELLAQFQKIIEGHQGPVQ